MSFFKHTAFKPLAILAGLAVALNVGRVAMTGQIMDLYLTWNMILALLPLAVSSFMLWYLGRPRVFGFVLVFAGLVWLALFPNAPYLLTDFIHLRAGATLPIWYNILMFFSAATLGMFAMFYSLMEIEVLLLKRWSVTVTRVIIAVLLLCTSFGIYIGRFLRWNSWDIFVNPRVLSNDIWQIVAQTEQHKDVVPFTLIFFAFLLISYVAWRSSRA